MNKFDKDGDGKVDWPEFQQASARFPSAFLPAFKLLDKWRSKIMGNRFWKRKKILFMKVRENMAKQRSEAAEEGKRIARAMKIEKLAERAERLKEKEREARKSPGSPAAKK